MASTRIVIVVGSLREASLNRQLAECVADRLEDRAELRWLEYADLPPMSQDLEWPVPAPVARVRAEVAAADGLWFVSPEYNGSYPGHVKNLVDWLSRPADPRDRGSTATIAGARATVSGAGGKSAAGGMRAKLVELLGRVGAEVMDGPAVGIALTAERLSSDVLAPTADELAAIAEQAEAFLEFVIGSDDMVPPPAGTSVPAEPSEGGVFATGADIGSCSDGGCSVY